MKAIQKRTSKRTLKIKLYQKALSIICTIVLLVTMTPASVLGVDEYGNTRKTPEEYGNCHRMENQ